MAEPPLSIDPEGLRPEVRKVGARWIDLTIAAAAIVLSLISLAVAIGNARTQEKMVAAETWPLLQFSTSNVDDATGRPSLTLEVNNAGAGPALLKHMVVRYKGATVPHWPALLTACCGWSPELWRETRRLDREASVISSDLDERVIRPGESIRFLRMDQRESVMPVWLGLERARNELVFEACYCSLFDECWVSDLRSLEAEPVKQCPQGSSYGE